jgi:pimeloyl-ACP methyl ester carboxylesterase
MNARADNLDDYWDRNRETTTQVAWKPYMHSRVLQHLLSGISVTAAVLESTSDRIVPREWSSSFAGALGSPTVAVEGAGHLAELECRARFSEAVIEALKDVDSASSRKATIR